MGEYSEDERGIAASASFPVAGREDVDAAYCLHFMSRVREAVFATVDGRGMPNARVIDIMHAEDDVLYFLTARGKAFYKELERCPFVSVVVQTLDFRTCRMLGRTRRSGDADEQRRLVDWMFKLNPSMGKLYPGNSRYVLEVFTIRDGEGEYFDLGQDPIVRVPFVLGKGVAGVSYVAGYRIGESCTGCGVCEDACPRNCIIAAEDGMRCIEQEACLHCGLCAEACPEGAIVAASVAGVS